MPQGALKSSMLAMGTLGIAELPEGSSPLSAPLSAAVSYRPVPQTEGIVTVIKRWAAAWLDGNKEAMFACLHPGLAKHIFGLETPNISDALRRIVGVQSLLGRAVRDRITDVNVWVLDVQGRGGSARVDLGPWTAFIHVAAHQNQWAIANVLWEWRS